MVEAPRIRITYEKIKFTKFRTICKISGPSYRKMNVNLVGYMIRKWWYAGKYIYMHLILENYPDYVIRTHMMMYGRILLSHEIVNPKLTIFMTIELDDNTILKWFLSQIKLLDPNCHNSITKTNYGECSSSKAIYDSIIMMKYDLSNKSFSEKKFYQHLYQGINKYPNDILTDFLLDQEYFPGIGNILQQEALYRCRLLPERIISKANQNDFTCIITSLKYVIDQLYQSYINKSKGLIHEPIFQIYHKSKCPLGHKTITKYIGKRNRRTTWCPICQK
ncbi:endonuclease VIII-like protein [Megavirus courdo7]|uniref:Endonuclease VIII-like protein n=1 Tax=Megavirus courdo7 TaxID=1128135 RepID=H2EAE2_9VIRU|nr:endonuclease VIII-like protein [Megavirus courdo7]